MERPPQEQIGEGVPLVVAELLSDVLIKSKSTVKLLKQIVWSGGLLSRFFCALRSDGGNQ
jgi:hypothetical protein